MGGGRRDGGKGNEGDAEGWREERRAYIEDRVRTVVKAGVELGGSRGEEEVLGLEGVVEGIQGVEG